MENFDTLLGLVKKTLTIHVKTLEFIFVMTLSMSLLTDKTIGKTFARKGLHDLRP